MKILTYSLQGHSFRLGVLLDDNTILDPQIAYAEKLKEEGLGDRAEVLSKELLPEDPTVFLQNGELSYEKTKEAIEYAGRVKATKALINKNDVTLGPPVLQPNKIICVGLNYKDHIKEMKREFPSFPVVFAKFSTAVAEPYGEFPLSSKLTQKLDYEGEFAVVIGKEAKNISRDNALDYVAGFTVANDITARDMQKRTIQWLQGKSLDRSLPLGPVLVTKDEIKDPHNLEISTSVNGQIRQKSNTNQLLFNVNYLVEFLSEIMTLQPGDVICTGTPGGVGEAQGLFLTDGDVVKVEISGIGEIETKIVEVAHNE